MLFIHLVQLLMVCGLPDRHRSPFSVVNHFKVVSSFTQVQKFNVHELFLYHSALLGVLSCEGAFVNSFKVVTNGFISIITIIQRLTFICYYI